MFSLGRRLDSAAGCFACSMTLRRTRMSSRGMGSEIERIDIIVCFRYTSTIYASLLLFL